MHRYLGWYLLVLSLLPLRTIQEIKGQGSLFMPGVKYLTTDHGLSQNEITCILQDSKGFLWIGTRGGLNRYDGHHFKVFQNEIGNINSLSNNSIESLFECSEGYIWIGTKSNGLSRLDPSTQKFVHYNNQDNPDKAVSGNRVISIAEDNAGKIWLGTWENGLSILDPITGSHQEMLPDSRARKIIKSSSGNMWVSSLHGLYEYDQEGILLRHVPAENFNFQDILEDSRENAIYAGTWNKGLWKLDLKNNVLSRVMGDASEPESPGVNNCYALFQDNDHKIWIGSWGGGLSQYVPEDQRFYSIDISSNNRQQGIELYRDVLFLFKDRSGIFWFGTNGGGIGRIDQNSNQFGLVNNENGISGVPNEPIYAIIKDHQGILWMGQKGSEYIYYSNDKTSFKPLLIPELEPGSRPERKKGARSIYQSNDHQLWMSTNASLFRINRVNNGFEIVPVEVAVEGQQRLRSLYHVSCLYQSSDGTFWIGQQHDGLKRSLGSGDPGNQIFRGYTVDEKADSGLQSNRVSALIEDSSGDFWVGTYNGLHCYDREKDDFIHYGKIPGDKNSLSSDIVITLYEDKKGRLWIGTPNGLNLKLPGPKNELRFRCYQKKDGLPNNYIHGILEDDHGNLWISTNKGIAKFNPEIEVFYNFDVNDGLQSNTYMEGVAWKDLSGKFYFGGINGLNIFHPDSIQELLEVPNVELTGLKIFDQEVTPGLALKGRVILEKAIEYTSAITLTPAENVFSIEFTPIDFKNSKHSFYQYKLEGLEDQWNATQEKTSITYAKLSPGDYVFKVRSASRNEEYTGNESSLAITILPPLWASYPAFIFYTLCFAGLLLLYRRFIRQQNELQNQLKFAHLEKEKEHEITEIKSEFFTNITHELRTPLTLISAPVDYILDNHSLSPENHRHLPTVKHHTRRLQDLVSQLLDFRKAESGNMKIQAAPGNIVKFSKEIFLSFSELADQKNINYQFQCPHAKISIYFDRRNMEIVLCNLLSNAFKHTPQGGSITLSIEKETKDLKDGYCVLTVMDSGTGMTDEETNKIFDRYYQIANTNSVKLIGTGIGLSLVKNIVELHHGKVHVESKLNKGSSFIVRLPLDEKIIEPEKIHDNYRSSEDIRLYQVNQIQERSKWVLKKDHDAGDSESRATILVVEDNTEIRDLIVSIFHKEYEVIVAGNGKEGLVAALKYIPDLIISDVMMPVMDGITLCKEIREKEKSAHIPIILLTARTSNVFQVKGFDSGADAYVTKPFQPSVLSAQVERLILSRLMLKERFSKVITLQPTDIEISSSDEQFLDSAIKYIEDNLANEHFGREVMAKALNTSSSSLYRRIKSLTGMTTNGFVRSIRLKRAAQLLQKSQFNISEIGYQVGFNDLKYFRNCFKAQFGVNPSDYIEMYMSGADIKET